MRKVILLIVISTKLCFSQENLFNLNQVSEIDKKSIEGVSFEIIEDFTKEELPSVFRLATILCTPYYIKNKLVKLKLEYLGDRETIIESFYYDNSQNIYFIRYTDSYYHPPKWDDKSKIVFETKINYSKEKDSWKSIGVNCKASKRLLNVISKLEIGEGMKWVLEKNSPK